MAIRNVTGTWDLQQTNNTRVKVNIPFVNADGTFVITATHPSGSRTVRGSGFGIVTTGSDLRDEINFRIGWDNETEGAYNGVFDLRGVINGSTFDVQNPEVFAGWKSLKSF